MTEKPSTQAQPTDQDALAAVTDDFIFGTMATDELRLAALRERGRGLRHEGVTAPLDPGPGETISIAVTAGEDVTAQRIWATYTTDGRDPDETSATIELARDEVEWDTLGWGYRERWRGVLPPQPDGTLLRYRIWAETPSDEIIGAEPDAETGQPGRFAVAIDRERVPIWLREAVIYQIFVDRFAPGEGRPWREDQPLDGFWGGTLRGVTEALPYLESLGVTCLWLSPIFSSPTHHGYDATDYLAIEPRLGTADDLRGLIEAAHARDMRVLLDFVANHVSNEHPAFVRAREGAGSSERSWFTFQPDGTYRSFFGVASMPQVNTDDPGARAMLIGAARHWLERGADGFRLDYANGPSHAFWAAFRQATRAVAPASATIGEIVESAAVQRSYAGRLDGTLDFLLLQQLRAFVAFDLIGPLAFHRFLTRHLAYFPADFVLPTFLDNHDMNRFLWIVRGDTRRLKLAALLQFTLPRPPIIYYGTEAGATQQHDLEYPDGSRKMEESRTPMPWGDEQDTDLIDFYRRLIAWRRPHLASLSGERVLRHWNARGLYVTMIGDGLMLALNRTGAAERVPVPAGATIEQATDDAARYERGELSLPPFVGAILSLPASGNAS